MQPFARPHEGRDRAGSRLSLRSAGMANMEQTVDRRVSKWPPEKRTLTCTGCRDDSGPLRTSVTLSNAAPQLPHCCHSSFTQHFGCFNVGTADKVAVGSMHAG